MSPARNSKWFKVFARHVYFLVSTNITGSYIELSVNIPWRHYQFSVAASLS